MLDRPWSKISTSVNQPDGLWEGKTGFPSLIGPHAPQKATVNGKISELSWSLWHLDGEPELIYLEIWTEPAA